MKQVTKVALWLVGAAFALACGGGEREFEDETIEMSAEPDMSEPVEFEGELGTAEFGLTVPTGYGVRLSDRRTRCTATTDCLVPKSKTQRYKLIGLGAAGGEIRKGADSAVLRWKAAASSARGWTVSETSGGDDTITISGEPIAGNALLTISYTTNAADDTTLPNGTKVSKSSRCVAKVDVTKATNQLNQSAACNAACREAAFHNLFGQALGRCVNLGTNTTSGFIMSENQTQLNGSSKMNYATAETAFLRDFAP